MFFIYASQAKRIFVLRSQKNRNKNNLKSQVFLYVFFKLFSLCFQEFFILISKNLRFC